jgi:glycosyltransferase involved in cell wall biosynthesis
MIHYAYQLCTALAKEGAEVTLITAKDYELDDYPHNFIVDKRMRLWPVFVNSKQAQQTGRMYRVWNRAWRTARRGLRFARLLREWFRLTNYLIVQQLDVIQLRDIFFPGAGFFLRRLRRHGLVITMICHEYETRDSDAFRINAIIDNIIDSWDVRKVCKNVSALFFHSEVNRERFLKQFSITAERTHIIYHGDENIFLSKAKNSGLIVRYDLAPSDQVVLFFGGLRSSKGIPDLLRAFSLLGKSHQAKLVIAGYPAQSVNMHEFYDLATELGITEQVIFDTRYIPMEEVGALMDLATVVVLPYLSATQSGPLMIAYAFGRPVVATTVGTLPEVVEDGRTGFLVPPASPPDLARAIEKILDDPALAKTMGENAKALSEECYGWRPVARKVLAVYQALVESERQGGN